MHIVTRWKYKCNKKHKKSMYKKNRAVYSGRENRKDGEMYTELKYAAKSNRGKVNGGDGEVQRKTPIKRPPN